MSKKSLTSEDIAKILEAIQKAYEQAGKKIVTAELYRPGEEEPEVLIAPKVDDEDLH